jgi:hypothetical protein
LKSALDTVWRLGLWQKLQKSVIQGNIFKVICIKISKHVYEKEKNVLYFLIVR